MMMTKMRVFATIVIDSTIFSPIVTLLTTAPMFAVLLPLLQTSRNVASRATGYLGELRPRVVPTFDLIASRFF